MVVRYKRKLRIKRLGKKKSNKEEEEEEEQDVTQSYLQHDKHDGLPRRPSGNSLQQQQQHHHPAISNDSGDSSSLDGSHTHPHHDQQQQQQQHQTNSLKRMTQPYASSVHSAVSSLTEGEMRQFDDFQFMDFHHTFGNDTDPADAHEENQQLHNGDDHPQPHRGSLITVPDKTDSEGEAKAVQNSSLASLEATRRAATELQCDVREWRKSIIDDWKKRVQKEKHHEQNEKQQQQRRVGENMVVPPSSPAVRGGRSLVGGHIPDSTSQGKPDATDTKPPSPAPATTTRDASKNHPSQTKPSTTTTQLTPTTTSTLPLCRSASATTPTTPKRPIPLTERRSSFGDERMLATAQMVSPAFRDRSSFRASSSFRESFYSDDDGSGGSCCSQEEDSGGSGTARALGSGGVDVANINQATETTKTKSTSNTATTTTTPTANNTTLGGGVPPQSYMLLEKFRLLTQHVVMYENASFFPSSGNNNPEARTSGDKDGRVVAAAAAANAGTGQFSALDDVLVLRSVLGHLHEFLLPQPDAPEEYINSKTSHSQKDGTIQVGQKSLADVISGRVRTTEGPDSPARTEDSMEDGYNTSAMGETPPPSFDENDDEEEEEDCKSVILGTLPPVEEVDNENAESSEVKWLETRAELLNVLDGLLDCMVMEMTRLVESSSNHRMASSPFQGGSAGGMKGSVGGAGATFDSMRAPTASARMKLGVTRRSSLGGAEKKPLRPSHGGHGLYEDVYARAMGTYRFLAMVLREGSMLIGHLQQRHQGGVMHGNKLGEPSHSQSATELFHPLQTGKALMEWRTNVRAFLLLRREKLHQEQNYCGYGGVADKELFGNGSKGSSDCGGCPFTILLKDDWLTEGVDAPGGMDCSTGPKELASGVFSVSATEAERRPTALLAVMVKARSDSLAPFAENVEDSRYGTMYSPKPAKNSQSEKVAAISKTEDFLNTFIATALKEVVPFVIWFLVSLKTLRVILIRSHWECVVLSGCAVVSGSMAWRSFLIRLGLRQRQQPGGLRKVLGAGVGNAHSGDSHESTSVAMRKTMHRVPTVPCKQTMLLRQKLEVEAVDKVINGVSNDVKDANGIVCRSIPTVILHGRKGVGKSSLAASVVRNDWIRQTFASRVSSHLVGKRSVKRDRPGQGVAWLSFEREQLTYSDLLEMYFHMLAQLFGDDEHDDIDKRLDRFGKGKHKNRIENNPPAAGRSSIFGWKQILSFVAPEDESDAAALMEQLKLEVHGLLKAAVQKQEVGCDEGTSRRPFLLVLDNVHVASDLRWFLFDDDNAAGTAGADCWAGNSASSSSSISCCQLLITTTTGKLHRIKDFLPRSQNDDTTQQIAAIQVPPLETSHALQIMLNGVHDVNVRRVVASAPKEVLQDLVELCHGLPTVIRVVGRIISEHLRCVVFKDNVQKIPADIGKETQVTWTSSLAKALTNVFGHGDNVNNGLSQSCSHDVALENELVHDTHIDVPPPQEVLDFLGELTAHLTYVCPISQEVSPCVSSEGSDDTRLLPPENEAQKYTYHLYNHRFLELSFSALCGDAAGVIQFCFSAFLLVFADDPYCDGPRPGRLIPTKVVSLFWEELLLKSEWISHSHVLALERVMSVVQQSIDDHVSNKETAGGCFGKLTRSGIILNRLEAMGLIELVPVSSSETHQESDVEDGMYWIKYDAGHLASGSFFAPSPPTSTAVSSSLHLRHEEEVARNQRLWNGFFVHAYEKMVRARSGCGDHENLSTMENAYFVQWLPLHMVRAGLVGRATAVLVDRNFIKNRFEALGSLAGTRQHILDSESVLDQLRHDNCSISDYRLTIITPQTAKSGIISSFERISDELQGNQVAAMNSGRLSRSLSQVSLLDAGVCLNLLGFSLQGNGWDNEAFAFYQEALFVTNRVRQKKNQRLRRVHHRIMSRILFSLGSIIEKKGDIEESIKTFTDALLFARSACGDDGSGGIDADVGRIQFRLGMTHLSAGNLDGALQLLSESLRTRQAVLGLFHEDVATTMHQLALCHREMKNSEEALNLLDDTLRIRTAVLSCKEDLGTTLHIIGNLQQELGRTDEAIQSFTEALRRKRKVLGKDHVEYADTLHCLGFALEQGELLQDALIAYSKALRIRRAAYGRDHVDVASTLHHLGNVHRELGHLVESQSYYREALIMRRKLLGGTHRDYARTLHNLGVVRKELGDTDGAMKAFTEALWVSKELNVNAPSAEAILERCQSLFGAASLNAPSESARMFSCVSLMAESIAASEPTTDSSNTSSLEDSDSNEQSDSLDWMRAIVPLLKCFVDAELAILGTAANVLEGNPTAPVVDSDENNGGDENRSRKVQFCACDCSAVAPPVDMNLGSHKHLEQGIDAVESMMAEVKMFLLRCTDTMTAASGNNVGNIGIAKLLLGLHALASEGGGEHLRIACSNAMPRVGGRLWPTARFVRAAQLYTAELEAVAARLETRSGEKEYECSSITPFRYRLATMVGSGIRFHLRRLFDFPPMGFTVPYGDFSACRARTYEFVSMSAPEGMTSSGDDGEPKLWQSSISFAFTVALRHVHSLLLSYDAVKMVFGGDGDNDTTSTVNTSVSAVGRRSSLSPLRQIHRSTSSRSLHRSSSTRSLHRSSSSRSLGDFSRRSTDRSHHPQADDDVDEILFDIHLARVTLAGAGATEFILALLSWPYVEECIAEAGGWADIERIAKIITKHDLGMDCPEEAHFALLQRMDHFKMLLEREVANIVALSEVADEFLHRLMNRYKGAGLRRRMRNENACLIRSMLVDGETTTPVFPDLSSPEYLAEE